MDIYPGPLTQNRDYLIMDRGTGRTTKQLKEAPFGCFYAISNYDEKIYTAHLAYALGREDLNVIILDRHTDLTRFRGIRKPILLDHHVAEALSTGLRDYVIIHNDAVDRRK